MPETTKEPTDLDLWLESSCAGAIRLEPSADFDYAILGVGTQFDLQPCIVYSTPKVLEVLQTAQSMSQEEAWEWFHFNIANAFYGIGTQPMFVEPFWDL